MKSIRWGTPRPQLLAAYLEGDVAASEAAAVEHYLAESSAARQQLEQLRSIRDRLSSSGQEFDELDLLPTIQARIRARTAVSVRANQSWVGRLLHRPAGVLVAVGVLAACLVVPFAPRILNHSAREVRAKSAGLDANSARWAGIQAYRMHAGKPERLGEALASGDGLLFSYTNLGGEPLANLMIFALDASGEVHWFHPAYEREGSNPGSISIEKGAAQVPLAELIQHEFPSGPLAIHALFSNRPVRVLEVEGWLKQDPRTSLSARVPGSVDQVLTTRVEP